MPIAPNEAQRYGRYVLLERIGMGGMAEVFRAVPHGTQGLQRILVLKRILPELCSDPRFVQMFIAEAKISALIAHPNVVQVFDFGRVGDTQFLTMEFIHGRNLRAVMSKVAKLNMTPPPDVMCEIVRQACLGLHHAHVMTNAEGTPLEIVHRDVTPANLMVGFNGAVKVLDFGIARAVGEIFAGNTQPGTMKGKVAYLAPEQIHREKIDHRVDVFTLGIVLHECLTGERLFPGSEPVTAMKAILEQAIVKPSSVNRFVPAKVDEIVGRALARDRGMRYQSAKAMALDLEAALHGMGYQSDRLVTFMNELFADAVAEKKEHVLPRELPGISAALAQADEYLATTKSPAYVAPSPTTDGAGKGARWQTLSLPQKVGIGIVPAVLAALILTVALWPRSAPSPKPRVMPPVAAVKPTGQARVLVSVDSSPQGAAILSDEGNELGKTPRTLEFPVSNTLVRLNVTLSGFVPTVLTVVPDASKPMFAYLKPIAAGKRQAAVKSAARARARPRTRPFVAKPRDAPLNPFAE